MVTELAGAFGEGDMAQRLWRLDLDHHLVVGCCPHEETWVQIASAALEPEVHNWLWREFRWR